MHPLREAMLDQMRLRGHSPRTQQSYVHAVSLLSRYYHRSPEQLTQDDLQNWILHLVKEQQLSAATCRLYLNAIRFFYLQVLQWPVCRLELTTPKRPQRIPYLLSPSEVRRIIDYAGNPKYAMMFALCYACGLRVSELVALEVSHIHGEAGYCQVVQGTKSRRFRRRAKRPSGPLARFCPANAARLLECLPAGILAVYRSRP